MSLYTLILVLLNFLDNTNSSKSKLYSSNLKTYKLIISKKHNYFEYYFDYIVTKERCKSG